MTFENQSFYTLSCLLSRISSFLKAPNLQQFQELCLYARVILNFKL